MFFTKKHKLKLEQEIEAMRSRAYQNELMFKALEEHLGLVIQRNWMAPPYLVMKKEDAKPAGLVGQALTTGFKL